MGTRNRLMLIASGAAVLLGAATLGVTALRATSPSDSDGIVQSTKKGNRQKAKAMPASIAEPRAACADPANDECEPQDERLAGIEAHKDRWLKDRYAVEIAYDPNAGTATAENAPDPASLSPEETNARLAEGQRRVVELFPELKGTVEKMNSEIAAERKLVDETGMTQQERAIHKYMNP